ncbi:MAG TPA: MarR family transcriptional regulator [Steroidobacteraceae bacterium]|nr:MarR family transcriptional regulator [Steroidobacteraceae bacterium]
MDQHQNFGFLLHDVTRLYKRRFEQRSMQLGLTLSQCKTLSLLARHEGISQRQLADLAEIDAMGIVRILDRMEEDGWVERRADPQDRRARRLALTAGAKPILDEVSRIAADTRSEVLLGLSVDQRDQLVSLLERVHANEQALKPLELS